MEEKTIDHLNTKVWYRLVKVIFILFFVASLLSANAIIFSEVDVKQVSFDDTKISCTYGQKKVFSPNEIGLNSWSLDIDAFSSDVFSYKTFFEETSEWDIRTILSACYEQENDYYDVYAMQRVYEVWGDERLRQSKEDRTPLTDFEMTYLESEIKEIESDYSLNKHKLLEFNVQLFTIAPVFTYIPFFKIIFFTNIIVLAVFEVVRRAFYYIALGRLRPLRK